MHRKELVGKLERVAPALSTNDLVPVLTHFCFTGKEVYAFNEQIGLSAPLRTDFKGAVPGNTLLSLLKASRAKEVTFEPGDEGELIVRAASSRFKLGMLPTDRFLWKPPAISEKEGVGVDGKKFLQGMACCMRSVSIDTSVPDMLGVTLIASGKSLALFATDNATLSYASVPLKSTAKWTRVILSGAFCRELIGLAVAGKPLHLEIKEDHALMGGAGGTILFGKLVHSPKPMNFYDRLEANFPESAEKKTIPVPTKLELVLERAVIVSAAAGEPVKTHIKIKDSVATFWTTSGSKVEVRDSMQLDKGQKDVELAINPKLLKNGYGSFDRMLITDRCVVMVGDDTTYLVAAE